ncbi:MAG: hypothetical protein KC425_27410, partial [Anaerolineales bacterium]|nr:hypothetical protein [Anaerolineales bacterium]
PPPDDLAQPEQQPAASGLRPPAPAPAQPDEDTPKPLLDNMDDTLQDILTDVFEDEDSLHVYQVLLQDVDEIPGTSLLQISSDTLAALRRHNRTRRRHAVRPKETT